MNIIIQNSLESLKTQLRLCVIWAMNHVPSWLALERATWRSKNCLSIFNHSNNHYDCWNRTDLKTAACYLRPAVAPLWIPLHDKHLSLSETSAVQYSESRKVGHRNSNSKLVELILQLTQMCLYIFFCDHKIHWSKTECASDSETYFSCFCKTN